MIKALPASSHYNATFKLAKHLQSKGHSITYVGNDNFQESVLANGFDYHFSDSHNRVYHSITNTWSFMVFPAINGNFSQGIRRFFYRIERFFFLLRLYRDTTGVARSEEHHLDLMSTIRPDLVILDVFYSFQISLFYHTRTKLLIFQTKFPTNRSPDIPPPCSLYVPSQDIISKIIVAALWKRYFVFRFLGDIGRRLKFLSNDEALIFSKYARRAGFPVKRYRERRAFHDAYSLYHELILSPQELDFMQIKRKKQVHMGPVVDMDREEAGYNYTYLLDRQKLRRLAEDNTIVYCSLGSLPNVDRKTSVNFFRRVIALFKELTDHVLILSVANFEICQFHIDSANVFLYQKVPQLEVLKIADVMITHGGMQTITECILSEVPMLVCPLNREFDQKGNAARIKFHGLGVIGDIKKDSLRTIKDKLQKLTTDSGYKANLAVMSKRIQQSDNFKNGIDFIDRYVNVT